MEDLLTNYDCDADYQSLEKFLSAKTQIEYGYAEIFQTLRVEYFVTKMSLCS